MTGSFEHFAIVEMHAFPLDAARGRLRYLRIVGRRGEHKVGSQTSQNPVDDVQLRGMFEWLKANVSPGRSAALVAKMGHFLVYPLITKELRRWRVSPTIKVWLLDTYGSKVDLLDTESLGDLFESNMLRVAGLAPKVLRNNVLQVNTLGRHESEEGGKGSKHDRGARLGRWLFERSGAPPGLTLMLAEQVHMTAVEWERKYGDKVEELPSFERIMSAFLLRSWIGGNECAEALGMLRLAQLFLGQGINVYRSTAFEEDKERGRPPFPESKGGLGTGGSGQSAG